MNKKALLALSISSALLTSSVNAANKIADARGNAMGNTGVASADYLTAPFYNPALGASFRDDDDFAILVPAVAASIYDVDDSLTTLDDLQTAIEDFESSGSTNVNALNRIDGYLDELQGNADLTVTVGLGFAIALPTKAVSTNLFARGYMEVVADMDISGDVNPVNRYTDSTVDMLAFGYAEMGLSLAKEFTIANEKVSFGITPKYQKMTTYAQRASVEDFDIEDYDKSEITKSAFNVDLGAMWYKGNVRAGLAVKDLFAQEIEANNNRGLTDTYKLDTQVTLGLAYVSDYFTAAFDADLTKQTRFQNRDDDTQFLRAGIEGNAWGWAQLRAGYEIDMEDTLDNSITAGIGISPFDVVSLDLAGAYAGDNQFAASANLAFTF
ncbi:conjugal transfer protein TraF [Psychromonas antarctica]|uniref:conjugal transfer protein TraF n=1 Tax=Psychromonas antarctica TaxID=67573 RepID=UPI001EE79B66|nr:conjugal transfer protein TraF [Psychromonas antarctica]MCG6199649.1 conjugal transfer protein TraF [Psychromonas antarctica]